MKIQIVYIDSNEPARFDYVGILLVDTLDPTVMQFIETHDGVSTQELNSNTNYHLNVRSWSIRFRYHAVMTEFKLLFSEYFE